jgi:hypothetical protein
MGKAGEERWSAGESAPVNIDTTKFSRCSNISGDDAEDTALLEGMHKDAQKFASSQKWCGPIQEEYLAFGVGGIIAVFLFKIRPLGDDVDPWIWVIVGDVPSAYITTEDNDTWQEALEGYVFEMRRWCRAVEADELTEDLIPVNATPTLENAKLLEQRLDFLDERFLNE